MPKRSAPAPPRLDDGSPRPPLPTQARSIAKRERLLLAARTVFTAHGYEAASVDDVANVAGVAVGGFYLHFASKRQLLVELMKELLATLQTVNLAPALPASGHQRKALYQYLRAVLMTDRGNYGVIRAWLEAVQTDPVIARMNAAIERWTDDRVLHVFEQIARHPGARRHRDLSDFARLMNRHFWTLLARGATASAREFDADVRVTADIIYFYLITG